MEDCRRCWLQLRRCSRHERRAPLLLAVAAARSQRSHGPTAAADETDSPHCSAPPKLLPSCSCSGQAAAPWAPQLRVASRRRAASRRRVASAPAGCSRESGAFGRGWGTREWCVGRRRATAARAQDGARQGEASAARLALTRRRGCTAVLTLLRAPLQVYHSDVPSEGEPQACGCALLPLNPKTRGPAKRTEGACAAREPRETLACTP